MSNSVKAHIGSLEDMGQRFIDAWHRAKLGLLSRTADQVVPPFAEVDARFVL